MLRFCLLLLLVAPSACVIRTAPLGGASTIVVDPNWTLDQRRAELERRELHPSVIVRVTTTTSGGRASSSVHVDQSALEQDGFNYSAVKYLPVLKAEGIATDIEDPTPYIQQAGKVRLYWTLGTLVGTGVGLQVALAANNDTVALAGLSVAGVSLLGGMVGSIVHPVVILQPVRKIYAKARRQRGKWSEAFNGGLAQKLGAGDTKVAPPKVEGPMMVPAPATETRHK